MNIAFGLVSLRWPFLFSERDFVAILEKATLMSIPYVYPYTVTEFFND